MVRYRFRHQHGGDNSERLVRATTWDGQSGGAFLSLIHSQEGKSEEVGVECRVAWLGAQWLGRSRARLLVRVLLC